MGNKTVYKKSGLLLFFISLFIVILGIVTGDLNEGILQKAVNVCLECIGIG